MHKFRERLLPPRRAAGAVVTPTVTRWHPAARVAGWTLLLMTVIALWVFGLG